MVHAHVPCVNSKVCVHDRLHAQNHGITDLQHFYARKLSTYEIFHAECGHSSI